MNDGVEKQDTDPGEVSAVAGASETREAIIGLIGQAEAGIAIVSDRLNPQLYNEPAFAEALRSRLLERRRLAVRIIVRQPRLAIVNSPRLIALVRRMGSNFVLRVPDGEQRDRSASVIADRHSFLYRPVSDRLHGTLCNDSPLRVKDQLERFEDLWAHSQSSIELREFRV